MLAGYYYYYLQPSSFVLLLPGVQELMKSIIRSASSSLQTLSPWVGLRKINVSYWGWEDASPFTNTSVRWLPGEPSDSGFCAYLERAQVAGLKANPCTATTDGLICEKAAGERE